MAYVRWKYINGYGPYAYLVKSVRHGKRVQQVFVRYLGTSPGGAGTAEGPEGTKERHTDRQHELGDGKVHTVHYVKTLPSGTKLYAERGVDPDSLEQTEDAYERLPPGMQKDVDFIEIYTGSGAVRTYDAEGKGLKFNEGGHWHRNDRTIRFFDSGPGRLAGWSNSFRDSDMLLAHETGHATWDRLRGDYTEYEERKSHLRDEARRSVSLDQIESRIQRQRRDVEEKYRAPAESAWNEYKRLSDRANDWSLADEYREKARKERARAQAKLTRLNNQRDKEMQAIPRVDQAYEQAIDEEQERRMAGDKKLAEVVRKDEAIRRFRDASNEEGGLTNYSGAWKAAGARSFYTENFAESTAAWYSNRHTQAEAERIARQYPKTYEAWRDIMENEYSGHYIPLSKRPKGDLTK